MQTDAQYRADRTVADQDEPAAVARLASVREAIARAARDAGRDPSDIRLVAVSKTHEGDAIMPVIEAGQRVFGENRVQEAMAKWPALRERHSGSEGGDALELRLIGPLQSNKAREAVAAFDAIESVDRPKIAVALMREMERAGRRLPVWVQVNTGEEPQKAGVAPGEAIAFARECVAMGHDVRGLMCIPPAEVNPGPHFALLAGLGREAGLPDLSMGMSGDYAEGVRQGATGVRVGSAIFGARPRPEA